MGLSVHPVYWLLRKYISVDLAARLPSGRVLIFLNNNYTRKIFSIREREMQFWGKSAEQRQFSAKYARGNKPSIVIGQWCTKLTANCVISNHMNFLVQFQIHVNTVSTREFFQILQILVIFENIFSCLFIPICTRNHVITYTKIITTFLPKVLSQITKVSSRPYQP